MAESYSVEAILTARDKSMTSTFKSVAKEIKGLDKQTAQFTDGFKSGMATIAKATAIGVTAFATFGVKSAAEIGAMNAQFEQVFGDLEGVAEEAVNGMSKEFGILPNRLKPMFSQTTSKFLGLGLDIEDAMTQATTATTLAADGAAFYDKSLADTTSGLNSFINGSYEGGEAIGLFANETQLAEWASKNLGEEFKDLDEAGKQVIRLKYAEAMYGMAGATGQAARESMTLENQLGNVMSAFGNFSAAVMEPIMEPFIYALADVAEDLNAMAEGIRNTNEWMTEHQSVVQATTTMLGSLVTALIVYNAWLWLTTVQVGTLTGAMVIATNASALFGTVLAFAASPITIVIMAIGLLIASFLLLTGNSEFLLNKLNELGFNMETVNMVVEKSKAAFQVVGEYVKLFAGYAVILAGQIAVLAGQLAVLAGQLVAVGIELYNSFVAYLPTIVGYLKQFGEATKVVFGYILKAIQPMIDKFVGMGTAIKEAFATGNFDGLKQVAMTLIPIVIGLFLAGIPKMILMGYNLLNAVAIGMGTTVPELLIVIINVITSMITQFVAYLPMILQVGMNILLALINGIITAMPFILDAIFLVLTTLIEAIVTYLPIIIDAGIKIILAIIQGLVTALPILVESLVMVISFLAQTVIGLLPVIILAGVQILLALIDGILQILPQLIVLAINLIIMVSDSLLSMLPVILAAGIEILLAIIDGIIQVLPALLMAAINVIISLSEALISMLPIILDAGIKILLALIKGVITILPQLIAMAVMLIIQLTIALIDMLPKIIDAGVEILLALIVGLIKTIPVLMSALPQIIDSIIDAFAEVDWADIGIQIIKGIGSGISSAAGSLWTAAKSVLGSFKNNVLEFFGIHSPSRWMRDMVGINLTEGIGVGVNKGEKGLLKTATSMSKSLANAISVPTVDIAGSYAKSNGSIKSAISHSINRVDPNTNSLLEQIANSRGVVMLDTGAIVGGTYNEYDKTGGTRTQLTERWGRA